MNHRAAGPDRDLGAVIDTVEDLEPCLLGAVRILRVADRTDVLIVGVVQAVHEVALMGRGGEVQLVIRGKQTRAGKEHQQLAVRRDARIA